MLPEHKHEIQRRYLRDCDCGKAKGKIKVTVGFVGKYGGEV
jgi:hypothetical protein